jgi:hypothetical protein
VIIVDWSDFELGRQWLMLKAAVPVGGRAISLYERVFPFKRYNSPGAHREFLQALRAIEETFRDLKCHRWGFGLRYDRCNSAGRLEVLLLLGALATLTAWLVGLVGRELQLNRRLQANTERGREVLSTFFIGRQLMRGLGDTLSPALIARALLTLRHQISASQSA